MSTILWNKITGSRLMPWLLVAAGVLAYVSTFGHPFIFDDAVAITGNPHVRRLFPIGLTARWLVDLTFRLNYAVGGYTPAGYHGVNLLIHLGAALFLFGILCGLTFWRQKVLPATFFGVLAFLGLGFITLPQHLKPVYKGWLKIAHLIGKTITVIMLTIAYYLVITPSAWIKRCFGGRPLPISPDRNRSSYWVSRPAPAQPKERFKKRF